MVEWMNEPEITEKRSQLNVQYIRIVAIAGNIH